MDRGVEALATAKTALEIAELIGDRQAICESRLLFAEASLKCGATEESAANLQSLAQLITDSPTDLLLSGEAQRLHGLAPEDQRRVLLEHGTEAAFCGVFLDNKKDGIYTCRFCGLPLFRSSAKFESGTGWPSFFAPFDAAHVREIRDTSYGMVRTEIVCARCGSHLGHVFPDGPPPTGERHCLNSLSLAFTRNGDLFPDPLQRGGAEAAPAS